VDCITVRQSSIVNLRDVGESSSEILSKAMNVLPLTFGNWWTNVVGCQLSLVELVLYYEDNGCN